MKKEKCLFLFINYDHYAMIKRKKNFFSISYYDHYAIIKREKGFFHSATLSTNEERKMLFFIYSLRSLFPDQEWEFFFPSLLLSLRYDQERKKFFFIQRLCPLMKKEKCCFSFIYYDYYAMTKSKSFFFI